MEANNYDFLDEALTVAVFLSAETTLLLGQRKTKKKKKQYNI